MNNFDTHSIIENPLVQWGAGNLTCEFCTARDAELHDDPCCFDEPWEEDDADRLDARTDEIERETPCEDCGDEVTDVAELFPAQAQAARMKILLARLDAACAKALADPPVYTVKWAPLSIVPRRKEEVAPRVRCICESHWACLTVLRADEFNERRSLPTVDDLGREIRGQDEWEVSDAVRKIAAEVEASCPASTHYSSITATVWYGNDVSTTDWSDPLDEKAIQTRIGLDDHLAAYCSRDAAEIRHAEEYEGYVATQEWVADLTRVRREQLAAVLHAIHGETIPELAVEWVQRKIEAKFGNQLRAYSACLFQLRKAVEKGRAVNYAGGREARVVVRG